MLMSAVMLAGCHDDSDEPFDLPTGEEVSSGTVFVNLRLTQADGGYSRADTPPSDPETPGTDREDEIETIDMLVCKVDNSGTAHLSHTFHFDDPNIIQQIRNDGYEFVINAANGDRLRFYAAANMTAAMRQAIHAQGIEATVRYPAETVYHTLIDQVVTGSKGGFQKELETNSGTIPMTGQFKTRSGETDFTIPIAGNDETNSLKINTELKRIVAKMLVLTTPDGTAPPNETDVQYLKSEDIDSEETDIDKKRIGWIRSTDVRYIPNGVGKTTFLFEHLSTDEAGVVTGVDPTMDLIPYMSGESLNEPLWRSDFVCRTGFDLHDDNLNSTSRMDIAEMYNKERFDATLESTETDRKPNRYKEGMYCIENYFDLPTGENDRSFFSNYNGQLPMVTHLSIAAKFTPRHILVEPTFKKSVDQFVNLFTLDPTKFKETYDNIPFTQDEAEYWTNTISKKFEGTLPNVHGFNEFTAESEKEARFILNISLKERNVWSENQNDYKKGKYPDGTFFVYDRQLPQTLHSETRYLYMTAGAVASASGDNQNIKRYAEAHPGGWGYYYTYLTNVRSEPEPSYTESNPTPYTESQIYRNTYYLVTITNFVSAGGRYNSPELIKVNTDGVGYSYAGKGDINLN